MKILSYDQATVKSGYSVFDNGYIESGVIQKNSKTPIDTRTQEMAKSICLKIAEVKPDVVVVEGIQNQNSIATVIQLARLQGAIMFYCVNKGIRIEILKPTEWRAALSYKQGSKVKREELKEQSRNYIKEHLGFEIKSEDECEAVAIGFAAQKLFN